MKIFRHKKNRRLYTIEYVNPPMILGSHYEASPYKWEGKRLKLSHDFMKKFEIVAER